MYRVGDARRCDNGIAQHPADLGPHRAAFGVLCDKAAVLKAVEALTPRSRSSGPGPCSRPAAGNGSAASRASHHRRQGGLVNLGSPSLHAITAPTAARSSSPEGTCLSSPDVSRRTHPNLHNQPALVQATLVLGSRLVQHRPGCTGAPTRLFRLPSCPMELRNWSFPRITVAASRRALFPEREGIRHDCDAAADGRAPPPRRRAIELCATAVCALQEQTVATLTSRRVSGSHAGPELGKLRPDPKRQELRVLREPLQLGQDLATSNANPASRCRHHSRMDKSTRERHSTRRASQDTISCSGLSSEASLARRM